MNKLEILESFRWLTDEFKTSDAGKNTIRIKGVALRSDVISKNKRKYVEEELVKSARTLIGKPITINHNPEMIVGNVDWAEYDDGALEYLGTIKKQPYVNLLRNGSTDIKGVSVEAGYLHNRCPKCGEKFYTEEAFHSHMTNEHFVKNGVGEPHGINYSALSLVLTPETPGVPDTTIELFETAGKGMLQLLETVTKAKKQQFKEMEKMSSKYILQEERRLSMQPSFLKEQDEHGCSEDEVWDEEQQKCVPKPVVTEQSEHDCAEGEMWSEDKGKCVPKTIEQEEHQCPEGQHWDAESESCVADTPKAEEQEQVKDEPSEPQPCPEGYKWSVEQGTCVAKEPEATTTTPEVTVLEQETPPPETPQVTPPLECPDGFHVEDGNCVPDEPPLVQAPPPMTTETLKLPAKLRLGEPFADYTSFDDCVSKNQDKDDPNAYCASIKQQVEGETFKATFRKININKSHIRQVTEAVNTLIDELAKIPKTVDAKININKSKLSPLATEIARANQQLKSMNYKLRVAEQKLSRIRVSPLATDIAKTKAELKGLTIKLAGLEKQVKEGLEGLANLNKEYVNYKEKQKLQETRQREDRIVDLLKEISVSLKNQAEIQMKHQTAIDNLQNQQKGTFKGNANPLNVETETPKEYVPKRGLHAEK